MSRRIIDIKHFFLVIIFLFISLAGFTQTFDDMPYSNPDRWTYFQQEVTSLLRFQTENDLNYLLFMSTSVHFSSLKYKDEYLESLYGMSVYEDRYKGCDDLNLILGLQSKINNSFYMSAITHIGKAESYIQLEEFDYIEYDTEKKGPMYAKDVNGGAFMGLGLILNTDILKGGLYLGMGVFEVSYENMEYYSNYDMVDQRVGFRIAIVPQVNTSGMSYLGKVLNNVLGYLGLGDNIVSSRDAKDPSALNAILSSLNAAVNLSFSEIELGPLTLFPQLIYTRGNFDAAAKSDTYGLKLQGLFSQRAPFGFILEGGYKHFFSVSRFFLSEYNDTVYFNGTLFYRFKNVDAGVTYHYDNIYKSKVTLAFSLHLPLAENLLRLSNINMSAFWTINPPEQYMDKEKTDPYLSFDLGARYRFGW